ncbi:ImmA/IrrE family metallo-endopeptidase [Corallococcus sp. CA054B]|uniref:ImmA/IrrE family metallo-endopeptidase n=1 Tax=Corallococcus sp. CA054B TaxID=2316734 RepID=UPI0013150B65|nr:ImmA/IrrE family metallo-endopeptidase [Corallococcus sp. CA054B]
MKFNKGGGGHCADRGQSYGSIETAAEGVRAKISPKLPLTQALAGCQVFERLGLFKVVVDKKTVGLDPAVSKVPEGVEALSLYWREKNVIVVALSEQTYGRLEEDDYRARFSVYHEVGHAVLHPGELLRRALMSHNAAAFYRGEPREHPLFMDTEWQANSFAGAMLMPAKGLAELERQKGRLTTIMVQRAFRVSSEAALIRLKIYNSRKDELLGT